MTSDLRVRRYPNGFVELRDGIVTIGGGETTTIAVRDVRSAVARAAKKGVFRAKGTAVLEIEFVSGLETQKHKLLIPEEDLSAAQTLVEAIAAARASSA